MRCCSAEIAGLILSLFTESARNLPNFAFFGRPWEDSGKRSLRGERCASLRADESVNETASTLLTGFRVFGNTI